MLIPLCASNWRCISHVWKKSMVILFGKNVGKQTKSFLRNKKAIENTLRVFTQTKTELKFIRHFVILAERLLNVTNKGINKIEKKSFSVVVNNDENVLINIKSIYQWFSANRIICFVSSNFTVCLSNFYF